MNAKVAVVGGGTGALGTAVVADLLANGWHVHVPWTSEGGADRLRGHVGGGERLRTHRADLTDAASVEALFAAVAAEHGCVDLLCNLVGAFTFGPVAETPPDAWRGMWETNATSAFLATRAAVPLLSASGDGRVVNVSAAAAAEGPRAELSAYLAAKSAVESLTRNLARELGPSGIRVNAVAPTILDTPANRRAMPRADPATWLDPAEVASVIRFLAGADAGIVTGSVLELRKY